MDEKKADMRARYKRTRPRVTLLQWMGLVAVLGVVLILVHHYFWR